MGHFLDLEEAINPLSAPSTPPYSYSLKASAKSSAVVCKKPNLFSESKGGDYHWAAYMLNLDQVQLLIINLSQCLLREVGEEVEVKREQSGSHGVIHGCMVLQGMSSLHSLSS